MKRDFIRLQAQNLIVLLVALAFGKGLRAQVFGGNPPSVRWKQVNNAAARVIFPAGLDSIARNVAGIVGALNASTKKSIGGREQKIDIVLQNQTTASNGYVGLGPFRSEFYLTAPQNSFTIGSLPWERQLALHEFRHVQQNNNFNVGLSHLMRVVFGQEGQALANSAVIPDWFYEGDAVYNETNLSRQGRGRLAYFFNDFRSLWEACKNYSWMKLRNGSYRDFVPDHYRLGYMQAAYGRQKYGEEFWKKVTQDAAAYKGLIYPFQNAIRRHSGIDYRMFRQDALAFFRDQDKKVFNAAIQPAGRFLEEEYPAYINDSTLVFVRSSFSQVPTFTIRKGNEEERIRIKDVSNDNHFSYRNGRIVYSAFRRDARWGWKNFGVIRLMDVETGKEKNISSRSKYFSPDINYEGSRIVVVENLPSGASSLHLLDAISGNVIVKFPNPQSYVYAYPKFVDDKTIVSVVKDRRGMMTIALTSVQNNTTSTLLPFSYHVMGFPSVKGDTVYFTASAGNADRIYALALSSGQLYQLPQSGVTGAYQPSAGKDSVVVSRFTVAGQRLEFTSNSPARWEKIDRNFFQRDLPGFGIEKLANNPLAGFAFDTSAPVTAYSKSTRLINFHSLEPLVDDPLYSVSIVGENVLNTMNTVLGLSYNRNEGYKRAGLSAVYGGLYPFLSAGLTYTQDRRGLFRNNRIYWNEWEWRGGFNIPLNFTAVNHITGLNFGADYIFNKPRFQGAYKDSIGNRAFGYVNSFLSFSNQVQRARQHIYPRFAQTVSLSYRRALSGATANQFLASGYLYFPGLFTNHSLVINAAFQQHDTLGQRSFTNGFPFSRGYIAENIRLMQKWGATYHLPLLYPDAGFAQIVYLLRIRGAGFYDHTHIQDARKNSADFRSTGGEVYLDTKWWNQLPLTFGFRISRLLDRDIFGGSGNLRYDFILPINILNN
jgi:hypothetical protein